MEDIVHSTGKHIVQFLFNILGDFLQVLFVFFWNNNSLYLRTYGTQGLFFETTYREYPSSQGNLSGHGYLLLHRCSGERRHQRGRHSDSRRGSIFRNGAGRHMDVNI